MALWRRNALPHASGAPEHRERSPFAAWLLTHVFRAWTALLTLLTFGFAFLYKPEWLTWWLRTTTAVIENTSLLLPYPWGDRFEVALRGIGGSFWIQITLAIIIVRVVASLLAAGWRRRRRKRYY